MTANRDASAIKCHLGYILASPTFVKSKRLAAFLAWVVDQSLTGNEAAINERNIAIAVYERREDFDSKLDGTVRAEAMRLRHKLREYYESASSQQRIEIPKGTYVPLFIGFDNHITKTIPQRYPQAAFFALMAAVLLVLGGYWFYSRNSPIGKASKLLAKANQLQLTGDLFSASALLDEAVAIAPDSADVHLARASVFQRLGHDAQARAEVGQAQELALRRGTYNPAIQLRLHSIDRDTNGAAKRVREMLSKAPNSPDLWLELARLDGPTEEVLRSVKRFPEAERSPELDRLQALALGTGGKNPEAIKIVVQGEQKAASLKATWMVGRLMVLEGGLRQNNSDDAAPLTLQRARDWCLQIHDDICVAQTYRIDGNRLYSHGHYVEALRAYRQGSILARRWQNWRETEFLLEGIEAVSAALHPNLDGVTLRAESFDLFSKPQP